MTKQLPLGTNHNILLKYISLDLLPLLVIFALFLIGISVVIDTKNAVKGESEVFDRGNLACIMFSTVLVITIMPGISFFYGGRVHPTNLIDTLLYSFVPIACVTICWLIFGFSIAFGKDVNVTGIMGSPATYFMFSNVGSSRAPIFASAVPLMAYSMFHLMLAIIAVSFISGALSERISFNKWMLFITLWHIFVYCPLAHMIWHELGLFRRFGILDFGGAVPILIGSGVTAMAGVAYLGPRSADRKSYPSSPYAPYVILGTGIIWFGWLGIAVGSAYGANVLACNAAMNTMASASMGMLTWLLVGFLLGLKPSSTGGCYGCLAGLTGITAGCGYVTVGGSLCIGFITATVCIVAYIDFKNWIAIDDPVDVIVLNGIGGICGFLLTGVFCSLDVNPNGRNGLIYGDAQTVGRHLALILVLVPVLLLWSYGCFWTSGQLCVSSHKIREPVLTKFDAAQTEETSSSISSVVFNQLHSSDASRD